MGADERATLLESVRVQQDRIRRLEFENRQMRRCLEAVGVCHVCDLCADSARHTIDAVGPDVG
jgi:hypothetical protein